MAGMAFQILAACGVSSMIIRLLGERSGAGRHLDLYHSPDNHINQKLQPVIYI